MQIAICALLDQLLQHIVSEICCSLVSRYVSQPIGLPRSFVRGLSKIEVILHHKLCAEEDEFIKKISPEAFYRGGEVQLANLMDMVR